MSLLFWLIGRSIVRANSGRTMDVSVLKCRCNCGGKSDQNVMRFLNFSPLSNRDSLLISERRCFLPCTLLKKKHLLGESRMKFLCTDMQSDLSSVNLTCTSIERMYAHSRVWVHS